MSLNKGQVQPGSVLLYVDWSWVDFYSKINSLPSKRCGMEKFLVGGADWGE